MSYGANQPATPYLDDNALRKPLGWKRGRKVFVCSMTDLFGDWVEDAWIDQAFAVMALCPQHTFRVLTKRPDRMRDYLATPDRHNRIELAADVAFPGKGQAAFGGKHMLPRLPFINVWLGVSVEDQKRADERIPLLLQTPANLRWLSLEPLLGPVDLRRYIPAELWKSVPRESAPKSIDWAVIGGESGHGARPCQVDWIRSLVKQCQGAGVPAFVKQIGSNIHCRNDEVADWFECGDNGHLQLGRTEKFQGAIGRVTGFRDSKGGGINEFPEDLRVRQFPQEVAAS